MVIVDFDALLKKPEAMNKKKGLKFSMATSRIEKKLLLLACSQANNNIANLSLLETKGPQDSPTACALQVTQKFLAELL